jgi:hypothetical protein
MPHLVAVDRYDCTTAKSTRPCMVRQDPPEVRCWIFTARAGNSGGEPAQVDAGVEQAFEHVLGQHGFGRELDLGADSGLRAALSVMDPRRRQVEFTVD